jgi:acyl-CoA dehydrogenase
MDFNLPQDTLMLRDMLRRFVQKEVRPLEMKFFTTGELEPEEKARLRTAIEQMGLWGLTLPEEFGGGLDLVSTCVIEEELGSTFIPIDIGAVTPLLFTCRGEQVTRYLEPALAGDRRAIIAAREPGPQGIQPENWGTTAVPEGNNYLLKGKKSISALPAEKDFFIIIASTPAGQTAFLVDADTPGIQITNHGERLLILENCSVSAQTILGDPGNAFQLGGDHARRAWIQTAARYVGIASRLLEMAREHARSWVSLGAPLAVRPAIQRMLAELHVDRESTRWLVYHAAWLADEGKREEWIPAAAEVRLASGEMLKRAVDRTTMLFNGPGPSEQIAPYTLVKSLVPFETLDFALESARAAIAHRLVSEAET